jgi:hypothetical protein
VVTISRLIDRAARRSTDPVQAGRLEFPGAAPDRLSTDLLRGEAEYRTWFAGNVAPIRERHSSQSQELISGLRRRYSAPIFGRVRVWTLIERLGACVDPTDERLYCASQLVHVRQMLDEMERDGVASEAAVLVTLLHDLGKLLLLTGEDPANVVCMNTLVGDPPEGVGLENCLVQWNHDEFAYERLKGLIDDDLAWLIRYHSLEIGTARGVMDDRDVERTSRLLVPFAHYDHATKSPFHLPATPLEKYRDVIEEAFPKPILF